jgi:ribonucleotide monophosphatase NagD (HAD superfamily)
VRDIVSLLSTQVSDLSFLTSVVSAGEVLHYCLRSPSKLGLSGRRYYNLGGHGADEVFEGLPYEKVSDLTDADFMFLGRLRHENDDLSLYTSELEHACSLGLELLCIGNDLAEFVAGKEAMGCGAVAEQYAVLGGKIVTVGKPQLPFVQYAAESLQTLPEKILFVGDGMAADIKAGNQIGADTLLVSKGIHVAFLGEGYIPDVEKARHLATAFDAYSDYIISGLRW